MRLSAPLLAIIMLAGCKQSPDPQTAANKALYERFVETQNNWDYDGLDALVAENLVRHCQATPDVNVRSLAEFKDFLKVWQAVMPDAHVTTNQILTEGDRIAIHGTFTGTQTGPMNGIPPTGKAISSEMIAIFRVADNKIAEIWVEWDNLAILSQLGAFPPPQASDA